MFSSYNGQAKPSAPITSRRKVFDNAMVAHVWAQQTNSEGRSGNGNFYFENDTIYSYGSHFPIARFTDATLDGQRVVLFNGDSRSVSTGQHQRYVASALRGLPVRVFDVPRLEGHLHPDNVRALVKRLEDAATRLAKAHVRDWSSDRDSNTPGDIVNARIESLAGIAIEVAHYCRAFGLEAPELNLTAKVDKIRAAFARYHNPKRVAKRQAAQANRGSRHWAIASQVAAFFEGVTDKKPNLHFVGYSAKNAIANMYGLTQYSLENRIDNMHRARMNARKPAAKRPITPEQWQNGATGDIAFTGQHRGDGRDRYDSWSGTWNAETLVRRVGDTLQTSRGAECPFAHAVIAFLKAQQCRATGTTWKRNGEQLRVGHFNVDSIDSEGNMTAGCHTLLWGEMLRLAIREIPERVKAPFGLPVVL